MDTPDKAQRLIQAHPETLEEHRGRLDWALGFAST
jgi:hypothetical protein